MAEKHIVVQGAQCKCDFGQTPDKIKVLSHKKEYANDKNASKNLSSQPKKLERLPLKKIRLATAPKWEILLRPANLS